MTVEKRPKNNFIQSIDLPCNKKYHTSNPVGQYLIDQFMKTLIDLVSGLPAKRILDIGCGEAVPLFHLSRYWPDDVIFHGLDQQLNLLAVAQQIFKRGSYYGGDIYNLPVANQPKYDLVICTEVLEHLPDPHTALKNLAHLSRSYCLLSVPNEPWWRIANMLRGKYVSEWGNTPDHVNHWSSTGFQQFAEQELIIEKVRQPFPWTMILARVP